MRIAPVISLLLSGLLLCSCENRTNVEIANEEGLLIIGNSTEPKGLDPHLVSGVPESNLIRALFEGLAGDHPTQDFTEWTFRLQPEGKWSDGVPVTAHDFVFAYHRVLDPGFPGDYSEMLYPLRHAEVINRNMRSFALLRDIEGLGLPPDQLKIPPFQGIENIDLGPLKDQALESLADALYEKRV